MPIPRKRIILLVIILAVLSAAAALTHVIRNLHLDDYRDEIARQVGSALNRRVAYERGDFAFSPAPSFTFTNVVIGERDGKSDFLTAGRLSFRIALLPLLRKQVVLSGIRLDTPHLKLVRYASGALNISDLTKTEGGKTTMRVKEIRMANGTIDFLDYAADPAGLSTSIRNADASVDDPTRGKKCRVKVSGHLAQGGQEGSVSASGTIVLAREGTDLSQSQAKLEVSLRGGSLSHFWPYYSKYVSFHKPAGTLNLEANVDGMLSRFSSKGNISFSGLSFTYPGVFNGTLTPREMKVGFSLALKPDEVAVRELDLRVDRLTVKGSCTVGSIGSGDPTINASASTSTFRLEEFSGYVPYGIIPTGTSQYIQEHIKGGTFQLLKGTLNGRASRIAHMEKDRNYEVLNIYGTVENGIVSYGPQVPLLHNIRGNLELSGKDFSLKGMSGLFGGSPFTLEGKLREYCTSAPTTYPFAMAISPRPQEVAWLVGKHSAGLRFDGNSDMHLNGDGVYENYELWGDWDLTSSSYAVDDFAFKQKGLPNTLKFRGRI
ncbi:MAG TPA: DUF748 domain-containing protein, partial [Verrucomicrobiae bacterium]|nr:DUF748 domain-containing protein [Verrucomicrobiae bacterium]